MPSRLPSAIFGAGLLFCLIWWTVTGGDYEAQKGLMDCGVIGVPVLIAFAMDSRHKLAQIADELESREEARKATERASRAE